MNKLTVPSVKAAMRWIVLPTLLLGGTLLWSGSFASAGAAGTGSITGKVAITKAPTPAKVAPADAFCKKQKVTDDRVQVTKGGVANVFVAIKGDVPGDYQAPSTPLVIDQKACRYTPRMNGMIVGQKIEVRNGDATLHNVHAYEVRDGDSETAFNMAQPSNARPLKKSTDAEPGDVVTLKCDVHPWMRADISVTSHPFFAVTKADGSFEIKDVPAGNYTLEIWHPVLGKKTSKVTVGAGKAAATNFKY